MKGKNRISVTLLAIIMTLSMSAAAFGETLPGTDPAAQDVSAAGETELSMLQSQEAEDPAQTEDPAQPGTEPTDPTDPTQPAVDPTQPATQPTKPAATGITESQALTIALKNAGLTRSKVKWVETEMEKGRTIEVEFTRISNRAEYDYEIAVKDGRILEKSVEYKYKKTKSKKKIGKKKARKIAAKAAGKSYKTVKKGTCKYTYKKKQGKYEVKFRSGSYKYEYEILAPNGKIVEYEYEYTGTR